MAQINAGNHTLVHGDDLHDDWLLDIQRDHPKVWQVINAAKAVYGDDRGEPSRAGWMSGSWRCTGCSGTTGASISTSTTPPKSTLKR